MENKIVVKENVSNTCLVGWVGFSHGCSLVGERSEPTECSCQSRFIKCILGRNFEATWYSKRNVCA